MKNYQEKLPTRNCQSKIYYKILQKYNNRGISQDKQPLSANIYIIYILSKALVL